MKRLVPYFILFAYILLQITILFSNNGIIFQLCSIFLLERKNTYTRFQRMQEGNIWLSLVGHIIVSSELFVNFWIILTILFCKWFETQQQKTKAKRCSITSKSVFSNYFIVVIYSFLKEYIFFHVVLSLYTKKVLCVESFLWNFINILYEVQVFLLSILMSFLLWYMINVPHLMNPRFKYISSQGLVDLVVV